jgi:hypothetical protein
MSFYIQDMDGYLKGCRARAMGGDLDKLMLNFSGGIEVNTGEGIVTVRGDQTAGQLARWWDANRPAATAVQEVAPEVVLDAAPPVFDTDPLVEDSPPAQEGGQPESFPEAVVEPEAVEPDGEPPQEASE